jgi:hypothetical protein
MTAGWLGIVVWRVGVGAGDRPLVPDSAQTDDADYDRDPHQTQDDTAVFHGSNLPCFAATHHAAAGH